MQSLAHHLLIAMPSLQDPVFSRTVTYLCEHNDDGAMGLILNRPVDISLQQLLVALTIKDEGFTLAPATNNQVLFGGPVNSDRGFVLHSAGSTFASSHQLTDEIALTTSKDVLEALGTLDQPQRYLVTLGYSGWSPGQLEQELRDNVWLTIPAEPELLFEVPQAQLWQQAVSRLGIDICHLSNDVGHA